MTQQQLQWRKEKAQREAFETMMTKGAEEFGGLWLQSHEAATQVVGKVGIDYTKLEIKAVMAATILHTLYAARRFHNKVTKP